jgi:hypothetical protein
MQATPAVAVVVAPEGKETFRVIALVPAAPVVLGLAEEMETQVRLAPQVVRGLRLPEYAKLFPVALLEMAGLGEMVGHKVAAGVLGTQ